MNVIDVDAGARLAASDEAREAVRRFCEDRDAVAERWRDAETAVQTLPAVSGDMTVLEVEARGVMRARAASLRHTLDVLDHRIALNVPLAAAFGHSPVRPSGELRAGRDAGTIEGTD